MRLTKKVAGTFVQKAVWTKTLDVKHYTKFTVTKDLSVLHVTDFVWGNHRPASVPSVSRADPVRATAGGNHCKSPPCLTCPQSGRKVLRSDVSTSAALWSVMSGIISRVLPSTPICAPPPEDLIEEWRDGRGLKALWGENGLCVCIRTVAYHLMCCHSSACGCVWMSVCPGDGRTAGCVSVARSSETFWRNRANQELRLLFNCRGLWALQLQFFTFWFYFDMIFILSWKYLWIHMTWSSNTMFISVLAFCQDTEKHRNQLRLGTAVMLKVTVTVFLRSAQQQTSHHCGAEGSFHHSVKFITQTALNEIKEKLPPIALKSLKYVTVALESVR